MADASSASDVEGRVIGILAQQAMLEAGDVSRDSTLDDLGIDSLGIVESIFAIEEEFDISIPFNANDPDSGDFDISSVGRIVDAVAGLVDAS